MKLNYTFSVNPPNPPKEVRLAGVVQHTYNEFILDLPDHWKSYPGPDSNTLNLHSEKEGAAIILSVQFFEIPAEKAADFADVNVNSRIAAHGAGSRRAALRSCAGLSNHILVASALR